MCTDLLRKVFKVAHTELRYIYIYIYIYRSGRRGESFYLTIETRTWFTVVPVATGKCSRVWGEGKGLYDVPFCSKRLHNTYVVCIIRVFEEKQIFFFNKRSKIFECVFCISDTFDIFLRIFLKIEKEN